MREPAFLSRRALAAAFPLAALAGASTAAAAAVTATVGADPVLAQIELHKVLRIRANTMPGNDDDPAYVAACAEEEATLQALGDMTPATVHGAVAQLLYMADVEGCFADPGSPLLRTVLSVARGLHQIARTAS